MVEYAARVLFRALRCHIVRGSLTWALSLLWASAKLISSGQGLQYGLSSEKEGASKIAVSRFLDACESKVSGNLLIFVPSVHLQWALVCFR